MNGFSLLMFIFGILIMLAGLYIYCGHNSEILLWRGYKKNRTKSELRYIGKWTIMAGIIPIILGIISLLFNIE